MNLKNYTPSKAESTISRTYTSTNPMPKNRKKTKLEKTKSFIRQFDFFGE
jgi:hypothetical protein